MAGQVGSVSYAPDVANAEATAPRVVYNFYNGTAATIADGHAVMIDKDVTTHGLGTAIKTNVDEDGKLVVGFADEAIPTLSWGKVIVYGIKVGVTGTGSISVGELVQADAATAGQVQGAELTGDDVHEAHTMGTALTASGDGETLTVWVQMR